MYIKLIEYYIRITLINYSGFFNFEKSPSPFCHRSVHLSWLNIFFRPRHSSPFMTVSDVIENTSYYMFFLLSMALIFLKIDCKAKYALVLVHGRPQSKINTIIDYGPWHDRGQFFLDLDPSFGRGQFWNPVPYQLKRGRNLPWSKCIYIYIYIEEIFTAVGSWTVVSYGIDFGPTLICWVMIFF